MHEPGPSSLLPPLVAIGLALGTRNVVLSLFVATWLASSLLAGGPIGGLYQTVDPFLLDAIADRDHMKVTLFALLIAGTVSVMSAGGGTRSMVGLLTGFARTRRRGMVVTWLSGLLVFFDDYANCLVVGNSMRPLCDRLRISREKLAFIVDSTAAPIASLALVSTWIGFEVGLIDDGLKAAGQSIDGYAYFVQGLGYRFYSLLCLVFVGAIAISGRDYGPMHAAEAQARPSGEVDDPPEPDGRPLLAVVAIAPLTVLLGVTFGVLYVSGSAAAGPGAALFEIIGGADGYDAMLKGSVASLVVALMLGVILGGLTPSKAFDSLLEGMSTLFQALVVLFLAWALGSAINELGAASYLVANLEGALSPALLPTIVFLVSAATAFATGTSFGTMGIVMPIVIPLSFSLSSDPVIGLAASGAVLSGACWGDHCSPISDTTVLSATGSGCDLDAHVRTQLPYALTVGAISVVLGTLPVGYGVPLVIVLPVAGLACIAAVYGLGRPQRAG